MAEWQRIHSEWLVVQESEIESLLNKIVGIVASNFEKDENSDNLIVKYFTSNDGDSKSDDTDLTEWSPGDSKSDDTDLTEWGPDDFSAENSNNCHTVLNNEEENSDVKTVTSEDTDSFSTVNKNENETSEAYSSSLLKNEDDYEDTRNSDLQTVTSEDTDSSSAENENETSEDYKNYDVENIGSIDLNDLNNGSSSSYLCDHDYTSIKDDNPGPSCSNNKKSKKQRRAEKREKEREEENRPDLMDCKVICTFYMENKCVKGESCPFSHDAVPRQSFKLCKFYLRGECAKGNRCVFMHGEYPCKYYHNGLHCVHGERCRFAHGGKLNDNVKKLFFGDT